MVATEFAFHTFPHCLRCARLLKQKTRKSVDSQKPRSVMIAKPQAKITCISIPPERHEVEELLIRLCENLGFASSDTEQLIIEGGERLTKGAVWLT